jgi:TPR repeat protein
MTRRRIGIGGLVLLMLAIGVWVMLPRHGSSSALKADVSATKSAAQEPPAQPVIAVVTPIKASDLWLRPSPEVASRNGRRSGFAWILRQLGASEDQLNQLADLGFAGVIAELKKKAKAGDPASINILGELAYQDCYLGRSDATVKGFVDSQIRDVQAVPAIDASWFSAVMRDDQAFYKQLRAACSEMDQDQVMSSVKARADQGDGASLWLMYMDSHNMNEMQQRLRDAAAAGFAQAQFELAWGILGGQEGIAGTGDGRVRAGDMLRASQDQLPRSESQLAICEFSGCDGVAVDVDAAIMHAREAAQRGSPEAMAYIGPHVPAGQLDPNEVTAWGLVQASLEQKGCGGSGFEIRTVKSMVNTLNANNVSAEARALAEQYWQEYGAQMMSSIGCTP